jgi:hypothetical protein
MIVVAVPVFLNPYVVAFGHKSFKLLYATNKNVGIG